MQSRVAPLVILASIAGFLFMATGASAKDGTVTVSAPGNDFRSVTVRLADLGSPDINNQEYLLASGRKTVSGFSLAKVLRSAGDESGGWLDPATIPSVEVDRPTADPQIEIDRSGIFEAGDRPPVFYENNGTTVFVMPGSPGAEYVFRLAPVGVKIGSGTVFPVSLSASPKKPRRGQKVTISAKVTGVPSEMTLTYSWAFSDGRTKTTSAPRVVHTFSGKGRRSVVVTVTGESGRGEAFLVIDEARDDGGGGTDKPRPGGNPTGGSGGSSGTGVYGGSGPDYGSGYGPGFGDSPEMGSVGVPDSSPLPPESEDRSVKETPDGLEEVTGVVIDPAASASAAAPEAQGPEGSGGFGGDGLGFSGEAATLFGVGLLIALGGLIETRILFRRF